MTDAPKTPRGLTRRQLLYTGAAAGGLALSGGSFVYWKQASRSARRSTVITKVSGYGTDLSKVITDGLALLGITAGHIKGRRILLKPNLVEPTTGVAHINTHPLVVRGAIEAFLRLGAATVLVGEGSGHGRDPLRNLEASGLAEVLVEDRIRFVDLNNDDLFTATNKGAYSRFQQFVLPAILQQVDWVVSLPKLKTHHWTGVTLSMKNLFGVMPGIYYGWPKNLLHHAGIERSILDIYATLRPQLAIVDGILGMEGDGPIMGTPKPAGVMVMGRDLPAVDATCSRIMGIDPLRVPYLAATQKPFGSLAHQVIGQRGESIAAVQAPFQLIQKIPIHRHLMGLPPAQLLKRG